MGGNEVAHRVEELARCLVGPLVLGGAVTLVRPFGARLALSIGDGRTLADPDLRSRIDVARVRRARLLAPVDTLPELDGAEWALAGALNDLLQITNHELSGALTHGRRARLLTNVRQLVDRVPVPRDVGAALARHATFARVLELGRTDTVVSWWTGKATFRGQPPAQRLLRWREFRRVQVNEQVVELQAMCDGVQGITQGAFCEVLGAWLTRTPLTDLATLTRAEPAFVWSPATLSLLAAPPGRTLAWRVLTRLPAETVVGRLTRAEQDLAPGPAKTLAQEFVAEVSQSLNSPNKKSTASA
jgi:hypothetical protein